MSKNVARVAAALVDPVIDLLKSVRLVLADPRHNTFLVRFLEISYSLSPGFWQSFISIEVCRDCIPALASSCKKQLTGFFVCLLFFLKVKRIS